MEAELVDHHHPTLGMDPALEHIAHVDHPGLFAGPPRPGRACTGGHDHGIGRLGSDHVGRGLHPDADVYALTAGGDDEVAGDVEELGPARYGRGHMSLSAESVVALEQHDLVPSLGGGDCSLQAPRAASDHNDLAPAAGERDDRRLASGQGVFDAAQPPIETHPAHALLIARQAGTDVGGMSGASLGREVGVGDLAPDHAHQIADTVSQRPVGLEWVLEPADPHDWDIDGVADGARDEQGVPRRDLHAGLDHVERGRGHPDRGVDVVDLSGGFDHAGHGYGIFDPGPAFDELVAA